MSAPFVYAQPSPIVVAKPAAARDSASAPVLVQTFDLSQVSNAPNAIAAAPETKPKVDLQKAKGKAKKAAASAAGRWTWTTFDRNGQPFENVLTVSVAKNGKVNGKLVDAAGEHELKNITVADGVAAFTLKKHTRGEGDLPHSYTVSLDPDNPQVSVEQPDFTPSGKARGGKSRGDHAAKHDPSG